MTRHDVDVAVIGAGTAGMSAARAAMKHGVSIALIEGGQYGTTCARVGCMPSKLLIAAAEAAHNIELAPAFGVLAGSMKIDGEAVMKRVRAERDRFVGFVTQSIEKDFPEVLHLRGLARFLDDHTLQVGDNVTVRASRIIIATGSRPAYPVAWKNEIGDRLIVNDDVFSWDALPESVALFGGGVIGLELAQALNRLGVRLRLLGKDNFVGPLTDHKVRDTAAQILSDEFSFFPDADVKSIMREDDRVVVTFDEAGIERTEYFDYMLAATGRRPNMDNVGIENTTLPVDEGGIPLFI